MFTTFPGGTKTLIMVAPLLNPYDRRGYCTLYVDSRIVSRPKNIVRDTIKVKFNTKVKKGSVPDNVKQCKHLDEDPLNECKPVNCDTYYNGRRSFFNTIKKRCAAVPSCAKAHKAAYNPLSNKCVYKPAISKEDIDYVKEIAVTDKERAAKNVMIFKVNNRNSTSATISSDDEKPESESQISSATLQNIDVNDKGIDTKGDKEIDKEVNKEADKDNDQNIEKALSNEIPDGKHKTDLKTKSKSKAKLIPIAQHKTKATTTKTKYKPSALIKAGNKIMAKLPIKDERLRNLLRYISTNKYTMMILTGVIFLQCCLICTMVYCITKSCGCFKKKHVVNRFFNYRQDASVTTPLIGTSNIDTETTEYQYLSESSNYIDKKIKCYKACQKERKNNMKLSMSDDILSKCLTRRDWHRLPRSETIPEVNNDDETLKDGKKDIHGAQKKGTEMKVNFQEEYTDKKAKPIKSIVKKESKSNQNIPSDSSEREIRCHNYNYDNSSNITGFKHSSHCNNYGVYNQEKKKSNSIEKGAQAYFSNDSLDDFLSERGVLFIGDNASKYSFTSISSAAKSSISSQSSKTSKNNIVKNVITLLSRKSKGPSSDPGIKKSKNDLDLELLHISRASVFSSSNDTDGGKDVKRIRDSTSSL